MEREQQEKSQGKNLKNGNLEKIQEQKAEDESDEEFDEEDEKYMNEDEKDRLRARRE